MKCRNCSYDLNTLFVNLGIAPPSNAYIYNKEDFETEKKYPLRVWVCENCWLVQTEDFTKPEELFTEDYAYLSSSSETWLKHAESFVTFAIKRCNLDTKSFVVELASNDGYLLKNFLLKKIPCLGIEPTEQASSISKKKGLDILTEFFSSSLVDSILNKYDKADLIIANNVLAHVPNIRDFVQGIKLLLADNGVVSIEFPHLLHLLAEKQFDTIYHEHYSYLSLHAVRYIAEMHQLTIYDVECLQTHGGSLRVWLCHNSKQQKIYSTVDQVLERESHLVTVDTYNQFQQDIKSIALKLKSYLIKKKLEGKKIVAYGAAAKGNTLLNYAGIGNDLISKVYDIAQSKQGKYLPGSHIPISCPSNLANDQPDIILILPWNIEKELKKKIRDYYKKPAIIVVAIPELRIESIN